MTAPRRTLAQDEDQTLRIHQAVRRLRRKTTDDSLRAYRDLMGALDAGGDPNTEYTDGRSPLNFLATDARAQGRGLNGVAQFAGAAGQLVKQGADPMLPGCVALTRGNSTMVREIVSAMRWRQTDDPQVRWHDGQNPLHRLVFNYASLYNLSGDDPSRPHGAFCKTWFSQARDSDGATPLHVLWQENRQAESDARSDPRLARERWTLTQRLMAGGADLVSVDHDGIRVSQLIENAVNENAYPDIDCPMALWAQVVAVEETQRLEASTAPAVRRGSGSVRL